MFLILAATRVTMLLLKQPICFCRMGFGNEVGMNMISILIDAMPTIVFLYCTASKKPFYNGVRMDKYMMVDIPACPHCV